MYETEKAILQLRIDMIAIVIRNLEKDDYVVRHIHANNAIEDALSYLESAIGSLAMGISRLENYDPPTKREEPPVDRSVLR